jgi:hypothetical protein
LSACRISQAEIERIAQAGPELIGEARAPPNPEASDDLYKEKSVKSIKMLGSGLAVVLALAALIGASSASAAWFTTESVGTKLSGGPLKSTSLKLAGETWQCGGERGQFRNIAVPTGSFGRTLTVPAWSPGCSYVGLESFWTGEYTKEDEEKKVPVTCKYELHAGTNESTLGWMDITGCENGGLVFTRTGPYCQVVIPNQNNLGPVEYVNQGTGSSRTIKVIANSKNLTFTRTGIGCFGSVGTFHNGEYSAEMIVSGKVGTEPAPVWVAPETSTHTWFTTQFAPAKVSGNRTSGRFGFDLGSNGSVSCSSYTSSGELTTLSATSLVMKPTYGECLLIGQEATLSPGGCSYTYHPNGTVDIGGGTCASNPITAKLNGGECTITIGPQAGLAGLGVTEEGWGPLRTVVSTGQAPGLAYTASGALCPEQGSFKSGAFGVKKWGPLAFTATNGGEPEGLWTE